MLCPPSSCIANARFPSLFTSPYRSTAARRVIFVGPINSHVVTRPGNAFITVLMCANKCSSTRTRALGTRSSTTVPS